MSKKVLYLIDATAFCYRAFYALGDLATSYGQPTNAIYGFLTMFNKLIKEKKPEYMGICFDVSRKTFRQEKFAEYKIQRPAMPEGLSSQIPLIKEIIAAYGIALFEKEGWEADDVIASLSRRARAAGFETVIVSSDKDILQLVDDATVVLSPGKQEETVYTEQAVRERFGVPPGRISDLLALVGDKVDNIPGVPGVGEMTAVKLLKQYGTLDNVFDNLESMKQEKLRDTLRAHKQQAYMSRELVALDETLAFDLDPESLRIGRPDTGALIELFRRFEFKRLLKEVQPTEEAYELDIQQYNDDTLGKFLQQAVQCLIIARDSSGALIGRCAGEVFRFQAQGRYAAELLGRADIRKVGHDLKALKVWLNSLGIRLEGIFFDTMIAAYVLNPGHSSYALSDLEWEYISHSMQPAEITGRIARLQETLSERMKSLSLEALFNDVEMPLVDVLAQMEIAGITLDEKFLSQLSVDMGRRLDTLTRDIHEAAGCQFNINSPKQLREVLFVRLKLPVVKKTKTGPSTDEEVLRTLAQEHPLAELLLEYRQLAKLKTTYIDALPALIDKRTLKLHTSFNQTGTETGRLSSSNPNLQNIPVKTDSGRLIRKALIASDSRHLLISCDYSQIELRILAHLCEDEALCRAFRQKKDIHRATAALIFGIEESGVSDQMRDAAKRVNFGIIYGLTAYGLSRDLRIPVAEAQHFIDAYFLRYPGVSGYINTQIEQARRDGYVTTLLGRRRYIPEINSKNMGIRQFAERQAVNTPVQGSAADLIKLAMVRLGDESCSLRLNSRMVLQVHDELVFDSPQKEADRMIQLARGIMEGVLELKVPLEVDIKTGPNWLDMEKIT